MDEFSEESLAKAIAVGLSKARDLAEPSCVAVVDAGGNLMAFARSNGAAFGVGDIAISKAYTSAALKCATADLYSDAQPGCEIYGLITAGTTRPFVVFGGGEPVLRNGVIVAAVGVSGGPVTADVQIAKAMKQFLEVAE